MSERLYHVEDFKARLEGCGVFKDVSCLGSLQMDHLWPITLKAAEGKRKFGGVQNLLVKEKKCFIFDPNRA